MTIPAYPNQFPSLTLDFVNSRKLDPRIAFSRASDATTPPTIGEGFGIVDGSWYQFQEDVPRLTDDGLLIEESRTNSITYSGDLGNTGTGGWYTDANKGGLNGSSGKNFFVTQSNTTDTLAPDGTYTATKLSPPSTIVAPQTTPSIGELQYAIHLVSKVTAPDGVSSFYIKDPSNFADGLNKIGIMSGGKFNPSKGYASFDLVNNEHNTVNTASDAKIEDAGNGWYRISCVTGEGGSWGFNAWNALTSDLYIWGAQCESGGAFPTSYIPTTTSAATRAADGCEINGSDFTSFFNFGDHTTVVEWDRDSDITDRGYLYRYMYGTNAASEFLEQLSIDSLLDVNLWWGQKDFANISYSKNKAAIAVVDGDASLAVGGTLISPTSNRAPSSGPTTRMVIGYNSTNEHLNGQIKRISFYTTRLSDEELEVLTA